MYTSWAQCISNFVVAYCSDLNITDNKNFVMYFWYWRQYTPHTTIIASSTVHWFWYCSMLYCFIYIFPPTYCKICNISITVSEIFTIAACRQTGLNIFNNPVAETWLWRLNGQLVSSFVQELFCRLFIFSFQTTDISEGEAFG